MADEMDENLSSNDETRVRLPGNEGMCTKQSSKRNNTETVSSFIRSGSKIHNISPKEPERT